MIRSIMYRNLRNGEITQYYNEFSDVLKEEDLEILSIKKQADDFFEVFDKLYSGYKFNQGSIFTEQLNALDGSRDSGVNGISHVLKGYIFHYDPVLRSSAELLKKEFDKHSDDIGNLSRNLETLTIDKICEKVNTDTELNSAAANLNLIEWFTYTCNENTKYKSVHRERLDEEMGLPKEQTTELRKEATKLYLELVTHINAHITIKGITDYENIVVPVNKLISEYNLTVSRRLSLKDDKPEE